MPYEPRFTSVEQDQVLLDSIDVFRTQSGAAVIDLDGVLFDTRFRQIRIVQDYARREGLTELMALKPEHFLDWSMSTTFVQLGIPVDRAKELAKQIRPYWEEQFFAPQSVFWDECLPGAPRWVNDLQAAGADIVYLTGRTESQRSATMAAFERDGFPVDGVELVMKASSKLKDHEYKANALVAIDAKSRVLLGIDNEPIQINHLARLFPNAMAIWMATDHSFRPERPNPNLAVLKGFLLRSHQ